MGYENGDRLAISRFLYPATRGPRVVAIPLGLTSLTGSSGLPGSDSETGRLILPYLALLHAGFTLPEELLPPRCALTAPFHPYPSSTRPRPRKEWRYLFCCTCRSVRLEAQPPAVSRRVALRRPDFPPCGFHHTAATCQPDPVYTIAATHPACKFRKPRNAFNRNRFQLLKYYKKEPI